MYDFDVILGMDWLSNHHASIDCFTKKIVCRKPGYRELEFEVDIRIQPTCVILTIEDKILIHEGYEAYLAHVTNNSSSEITLDNVSIVREFPDMFSKDLPGLPPDRELEFGRELLPGLAPVSIPPTV